MSQLLRKLDFGVARVQRRGFNSRVVVAELALVHHEPAFAYRVPAGKCPVKTGQRLLVNAGEALRRKRPRANIDRRAADGAYCLRKDSEQEPVALFARNVSRFPKRLSVSW
jgi:hypothetical protein